MININLVPDNLRKKRRKTVNPLTDLHLPPELMIGLVGGLLCLLTAIHLVLWVMIAQKSAQNKKLDQQMQTLLPNKHQADAIAKELRVLQGKKNAIEKMTSMPKILWAPKLNDLSDSMPKGVWLDRISLDQGIFTINGSSVARGGDEMMGVVDLVSKLKNTKEFVKQLKSLEVGQIQRKKIETVDVADFSITAKFQ